ncbi:MAG: RNA polymerase sigma factor [Planctomycetaceae bacterium]
MSDARILNLVRQARSGDREAFGELAVIFEPTVFAVALRTLRNRSEAREVTQDVLIQAYRKLPQLREPERFAGWLRQIANRMSINRAVRRPKETMRSPETFDTVRSDPDTPLDGVLRDEQRGQVRDGLNRLRDLDRDTLIAFYFEGKSLQEMSDSFRSPIGTIKRRLHTARHRLRDELSVNPA